MTALVVTAARLRTREVLDVHCAAGLRDYGLRVGGPADLLVHGATRTVDLLARHEPPRVVVRAGRVL